MPVRNSINLALGAALTVLILFCCTQTALATHNRAGDISVEQVGDCVTTLTIKATITTYTKASNTQVDRDSLTICWGDGNCERVLRSNGPGNPPRGEVLENDVKKNIYIAFHTYPARSTYVISMTDPNRNGGILNVNFPNSVQIPFHLATTYTFPNPQFQGCNDTPVLLQPPVDVGCVGKTFIHNVNAYDRDGDSLSYEFIVPRQNVNLDVPNYLFPNAISPGPDNTLTIDPVTGDIVWDAPQRAGEYNLAMIIIEWRNGSPLDTIIRDMQILIEECDNLPPEVEVPQEEYCVVAGDTLEFEVVTTAPLMETDQKVRLTALGGPFEEEFSPATLTPNDNVFRDDPVTKTFRWIPACESISDQFYSVVFKGTDDFLGDTTGLATLKTVRIKVVGPPPENVRATPQMGYADVTWESPYSCEEAAGNYFQGFTVWRREGSNAFERDTCVTGLAGRGYTKLNQIPVANLVDGRYYFRDDNIEPGRTYCYRILAEFALTTPGGQYLYNIVESLPSDETCLQLNRDVPLIVKADVLTTSDTQGQVEVCFTKPSAEDLDTIQNPGPYLYELQRAPGLNPTEADFQVIHSVESLTFSSIIDTCFTDTGLNTLERPYTYRINFFTGNSLSMPLGTSSAASTVYLRTSGTDRAVNLAWDYNTPWDNYRFIVYRQNPQGGFDSIATVDTPVYTDTGLENGTEYCYFIRALGTYGIPNLPEPLINNSQESCATARDDVPPCAPMLDATNFCETDGNGCPDPRDFYNQLDWDNPNLVCDDTDDVAGYYIYLVTAEGTVIEQVAQIDEENTLSFQHFREGTLAGCYAVSAYDANGNESELSNIVCVDNCPSYQLPNAFTPNGDGQNDMYRPYPFCFIDQVEFMVFNRWGQLVFETSDPNLNWDGRNLNGDPLEDGVYFYKCRVFESKLDGVAEQEMQLSGYIELLSGQ